MVKKSRYYLVQRDLKTGCVELFNDRSSGIVGGLKSRSYKDFMIISSCAAALCLTFSKVSTGSHSSVIFMLYRWKVDDYLMRKRELLADLADFKENER